MRTSPRGPVGTGSTLLALAALMLSVGCGGSAEERVLGPVASAAPLVGRERRLAQAAATPTDELHVALPAGATRAIVHVAAVKLNGWWSLPSRDAVARVRLSADGSSGAELLARDIPVRSAERGAWERLEVDLPPDAGSAAGPPRELRLSLDKAHGAERAWWSVRFEDLAPAGSRNVLLISLDTVRVDAVSAFGQPIRTTPRLDGLTERGTMFTQAISAAPWTLPSHVSVMTGVLPSWHGRVDPLRLDRELPPLPTLATILGERGYESIAITGSGSISWALGATRGFASIIENEPTRDPKWWRTVEPECNVGARDAIAFLESRVGTQGRAPFFLFWHTYEPHFPYHDERFRGTRAPLPAGVPDDAREEWQRYLGDVARADAALGAILDTLERAGLAGSTDIIVMSDHGEDFGEHSQGRREESTRHGNGLFETQLRVPLVIVSPSIAPGRRDEQVSLLDIFPTILAFAGLDTPSSAQGHALQVPGGSPRAVSEGLYARYAARESKSLREGAGLKYVVTLSQPAQESLFDVNADRLEASNLAATHGDDVARLRELLLDALDGAPPAPARVGGDASTSALPPSVLESLRSLGYVE